MIDDVQSDVACSGECMCRAMQKAKGESAVSFAFSAYLLIDVSSQPDVIARALEKAAGPEKLKQLKNHKKKLDLIIKVRSN